MPLLRSPSAAFAWKGPPAVEAPDIEFEGEAVTAAQCEISIPFAKMLGLLQDTWTQVSDDLFGLDIAAVAARAMKPAVLNAQVMAALQLRAESVPVAEEREEAKARRWCAAFRAGPGTARGDLDGDDIAVKLVSFLKATARHCPNTHALQTRTQKELPEKPPDVWEVQGSVQEYLRRVFRVATLKARGQATACAEIGQDGVQRSASKKLVGFLKATALHCPSAKPLQTKTQKDLPEKSPDLWEVQGPVKEYLGHVFRVATLKVRGQATAVAEAAQKDVFKSVLGKRVKLLPPTVECRMIFWRLLCAMDLPIESLDLLYPVTEPRGTHGNGDVARLDQPQVIESMAAREISVNFGMTLTQSICDAMLPVQSLRFLSQQHDAAREICGSNIN
eukprot:Skav236225  [mRNA]  locus=scaffold132:173222:180405:+ [translate_table: standard]